MTDLFLKIVDMSVSASVVIAAVLITRLLLRKAPKKWSYLLWSVAAFRLCCPVSVQAAFSVFRIQPIQPAFTQTAAQTTAISYLPQVSYTPVPSAAVTADPVPLPAAPADPMQSVLTAAAVIWCIGMAVLLIYSIVSYAKTRNTVLDAVLLRDNIYESDRIRSPFILGVFSPKIYIPCGLDEKQMQYVLEHEQYHIRRLDHLMNLFCPL